MTREERKQSTHIGSAEVRLENTTLRDNLVKAAKKAGFIVECSEAIPISLSGRAGLEHWAISVSIPAKLDSLEKAEAKRKLHAAWSKCL